MRVRNATWDDLEAVDELVAACDLHDTGERDMSLEELCDTWRTPGVEIDRDVFVVELQSDLAGYAWVWERTPRRPVVEGYVHPESRGQGVGLELVRRTEQRAHEMGAVLIANYVLASDSVARTLLEDRGYGLVRSYFRMAIDLVHAIDPPHFPAGVTTRGFRRGTDDQAVHDAVNEAFAGQWSFAPESLDSWRKRHLERDDVDPALWQLAVDRDEIVGCTVCSPTAGGVYVDALAVRPAWQKRGIGLALLRSTFQVASERGHARVTLGVDSENEAGATRLYERAGMRVVFGFVRYELDLT